MPNAQTQMEPSHVLANLVLLDREHLVSVCKDPAFYLLLIFQVLYYSLILIVFVYLQMWMSVPLTPITAILMPTALTQTEASHVPANLVLVDREHRVLVS